MTHRASLLAFALAACGNSPSGTVDAPRTVDAPASTTHVDGMVNGRAFDAMDTISTPIASTNGFNFEGPATFVQISDFAGACALSQQVTGPADSRILLLAVAADDASGKATAPTALGAYTVYDGSGSLPPSANVAQAYYGSGCGKDVAYSGTTGTITLTKINADGTLEGTFDVTLSCAAFASCTGGDAHLTGAFQSTACAALDINSTPTCQ